MLATEGESVHEEFLEEEGGGEGESVLSEYDDEDFVSGAVTSVDSSMPYDLFEFEYPLRSGLIFSSREFGLRGETSLADDRIDNISYIGIRFLVFICIKDVRLINFYHLGT